MPIRCSREGAHLSTVQLRTSSRFSFGDSSPPLVFGLSRSSFLRTFSGTLKRALQIGCWTGTDWAQRWAYPLRARWEQPEMISSFFFRPTPRLIFLPYALVLDPLVASPARPRDQLRNAGTRTRAFDVLFRLTRWHIEDRVLARALGHGCPAPFDNNKCANIFVFLSFRVLDVKFSNTFYKISESFIERLQRSRTDHGTRPWMLW